MKKWIWEASYRSALWQNKTPKGWWYTLAFSKSSHGGSIKVNLNLICRELSKSKIEKNNRSVTYGV